MLLFSQRKMAFPIVAPPGVLEDRISALRVAFDKTMKDPDCAAALKKINFSIDPVSGVDIPQAAGRGL